ncbi:MAG TPA: MmgE/PrpD family protein [Acidimicrobiales bacterium]|nr:MmgE/PrpD family protein [Acidimicrobiales bacterium]
MASVTEQLATWVVEVDQQTLPAIAQERVGNLVLDSIGNQFAGMAASTGRLLAEWVRGQGGAQVCTVTGRDFKTTPALATLVNGAASHALENDDIATFSSHPNSPLTAASLALGEKLGSSGRDVVVAWAIGWEVTAQTMKVCLGPRGNELINRGWFNQGFQETLGVAALASRLLGLGVDETRMAIGHAASAMGGMMKNRGTDTKGFTAGSAAMHGVMAAELASTGFTADLDILDGDIGVARLLGLDAGDPEKMLDGLGSWDLATRGATIRLHACCGASHWSMDALQQLLRRRPVAPDDIEAIDVEIPEFLTDMVPNHDPQTGLQAKYSLEHSLAAVALHGRAGIHQFADDAVRQPEAHELRKRVTIMPVPAQGPLQSRVIVTLRDGERLEEVATRSHGSPADPLTDDERLAKFHECAGTLAPQEQRDRVIELTTRLDSLADVGELTAVLAVASPQGT